MLDFYELKIFDDRLELRDEPIPLSEIKTVRIVADKSSFIEVWGANPVKWVLRPIFYLILMMLAYDAYKRDGKSRREEKRRFRTIVETGSGEIEVYRGFGVNGDRTSREIGDAIQESL